MNTLKMLSEFEESAKHLDRNSRVAECENSIKFLEAKIKKIEIILKDIPARYVMPKASKVLLEKPEKCTKCEDLKHKYISQIEALIKKKEVIRLKEQETDVEHSFLLRRVVAVYGNKALVDLMNHIENPARSDQRLEQYMKVRPHF